MYERTGDLANAEAVYVSSFEASGATEVADRWLALLLRQKRYAEARTILDRLKQKLDERGLRLRG